MLVSFPDVAEDDDEEEVEDNDDNNTDDTLLWLDEEIIISARSIMFVTTDTVNCNQNLQINFDLKKSTSHKYLNRYTH